MRKTVIGAATIALLCTTALVSAQQMQEPKSQPSAKDQGPAPGGKSGSESKSGSEKGAQRSNEGADSGKSSASPGDKGKSAQGGASDSKGRAEKSDSRQDRKGSAQKQTDQSKDRTAEPKNGDAAKSKTAEPKDKAGDSKSRTAEPKDRAGDRRDRNKDAARDRDEPGKQRDQAQQGKGDKDGKDGQRGDQARQGKDGDRANLSQDQRTQVRERLGRNREARHTNVSFSINIGTRVPRDFRLQVVPTDIVTLVPAYRGYRYFIVDERVVIVHPTRYEIVEVIEVDGPRRGGSVTASLDLSSAQVALILDRIPRDRHRADVSVDLALGAEVPSSVELYEFPDDVVVEIPAVRQYRYVVLERRVLIVDPSGRDVIRVIDR